MMQHLNQDVLYYGAFLCGQLLFILKRAASAIRSKTNPIATRGAFLKANWDVLLIRLCIELPVYYIFRHYSANTILSLFTTWQIPFQVPQGAMSSFMLGFIADSLLDWFGASNKAPAWLKETIPGVQVYSARTVESGKDAAGAPVTVEKTITIEKTDPKALSSKGDSNEKQT